MVLMQVEANHMHYEAVGLLPYLFVGVVEGGRVNVTPCLNFVRVAA